MSRTSQSNKISIATILIGSVLLAALFLFPGFLPSLNLEKNHLAFHTLLEFFSVFVSFSISAFGWIAFRDMRTTTMLWLPIVFTAIGALDLLHALSYEGMPFFITENSAGKSIWFWIAARLTESVALLALLAHKEKPVTRKQYGALLLLPWAYVLLLAVIIIRFEASLPTLVVNGAGTTALKNALEYVNAALHAASIVFVVRYYRQTRSRTELELVFGIGLLLAASLLFTVYVHILDSIVIAGHLLKVAGYVFIFRCFYFARLEMIFQHKQRTEQDLQEVRGKLESFIEHTPDCIAFQDLKGRIVQVNHGFETIFGVCAEEAVGKRLSDLVSACRMDLKPLRKVFAGEPLIGHEMVIERKDGKTVRISTTLSPVRNAAGERVSIASISRDITEQKEAEAKLRQAEQELVETVREHQGMILKYKIQEGRIIHTLCDGQLLYDMQLQPEQIVGQGLPAIWLDDGQQRFHEHYQTAWAGRRVDFEATIQGIVCFITLSPIRRNGVIAEVIGSWINITKLKKTEELLQKSEKLAVVGELAAGVAHEIRNPLTTLKGFTQILGMKVDEDSQPFIELMMSELERIEAITSEFMVVAKPQQNQYEPVDIPQVLQQVIQLLGPQATLNNVQISLEVDAAVTTIYGDANQMKQVFMNVMKNAIESMERGGSMYIEVDNPQAGQLCVKVRDTGSGIPADMLPRLGEPFYTLKEKGTGLGLMVSYRIIEAHQGRISFDSEVGLGTTVRIALPTKSGF
ncbi:PAS domain S-box protein [Xylanibacillus composti]|nr:MASE3 domain-containing protein [Xylanibacillus composti]MDT9726484.1 PAS domain S-box protein [Xylanibacillus composti]